MTEEELGRIIARHEMHRLELKESFNVECIESACALANAEGGYIVLGVDNSGAHVSKPLRFEGLRDYENRIATSTEPVVSVDAEKVSMDGREVVVLRVQENPLKPVAYKGRCYIRRGSVNHQMTPSEIAECHLKSTGSSMDSVFVSGALKEDLDMEKVRLYMQKAVLENRRDFAAGEDPWRTLLKLGLVKSESEITRAAYLLFAKFPQQRFPQAIIHSGAFKADGAVIIDSHDSTGNIQDQIEDALAFIQRNIRCAIVVSDKASHDRYWEYPIEGLREVLANAVCHRDYALGDDIQVKIYEDRVVVSSPGLLPFDMSLEYLEDPDHESRPRNKLIAQAFYDLHVIEHYGSGVRRIKHSCDQNGSPYPIWKNSSGMLQVKFMKRTQESVAGLGIDPAKLGVEADPQNGATNLQVGANVEESGVKASQVGADEEIVGAKFNAVMSEYRSDFRETCYRVWSLLRGDDSLTQRGICRTLKVANSSVQKAYKALQKAGLLVNDGSARGRKWRVNMPITESPTSKADVGKGAGSLKPSRRWG